MKDYSGHVMAMNHKTPGAMLKKPCVSNPKTNHLGAKTKKGPKRGSSNPNPAAYDADADEG